MRRSPARFLAPIALVAVAFALYSVAQDSNKSPSNSNGSNATATPSAGGKKSTSKKKSSSSSSKKRKTYTVKAGDTLSAIAEKTGVSLETLNDLNPDVETLSPGQKLKLR
jgi:LysM repeat protein